MPRSPRRARSGVVLIATLRRVTVLLWLFGLLPAATDGGSLNAIARPMSVAAQDDPASGDTTATQADAGAGRADRRPARDNQPSGAEPSPTDEALDAPTDKFNCIDFATREEAQAVLDEDRDDPNNLDPTGDGTACSLLPTEADLAGADTPRPADKPNGGGGGGGGSDGGQSRRDRGTPEENSQRSSSGCIDVTQEEAQAILDDDPSDPDNLDPDGDGIACEAAELAGSPAAAKEPPATDRQRSTVGFEDLDCADFAFQEDAQLVLGDLPADPYNLDPNGDAFACSSLPSTTGAPQINAVPTTGVGPASPSTAEIGLLLLGAGAGFGAVGVRCRRRRVPA